MKNRPKHHPPSVPFQKWVTPFSIAFPNHVPFPRQPHPVDHDGFAPPVPMLYVCMTTQGLQLWADLQVLMGPFDALARRRPERHFPALAEAAVLLSLEKASACLR